ncbi:helix-turn-helix domain-containing protein [Bradyrhizobium sp. HKCCYLS1011]|uniref:helix-turn-helix domain-containing protein n=1 Tax=Bradyrhizobium sp. HKCCYLS1011 TaxID=3420733 RepID=UPI003EB7CBB3
MTEPDKTTPATSIKHRSKKLHRDYPVPPPNRLSLSLNETCGLTGIGMTAIRQAIDAGLLPAHRLGKKVVVRRQDVDDFLKRLPSGLRKRNSPKHPAG